MLLIISKQSLTCASRHSDVGTDELSFLFLKLWSSNILVNCAESWFCIVLTTFGHAMVSEVLLWKAQLIHCHGFSSLKAVAAEWQTHIGHCLLTDTSLACFV